MLRQEIARHAIAQRNDHELQQWADGARRPSRVQQWEDLREVEFGLWLTANVGSPSRRRQVRAVCECLDDLAYCKWAALEHHLDLNAWPALTRRRFVAAVRALRGEDAEAAAEAPAYARADAETAPRETEALAYDQRTVAAALADRARRERVDAAIAAARAPQARAPSASSGEDGARRRRSADADGDASDESSESDDGMPALEDAAADGCARPVPWRRADAVLGRLEGAVSFDPNACCAICLDVLEDETSVLDTSVDALDRAVVMMPCGAAVPHYFHRGCALRMLDAAAARGDHVPRCPTCRGEFPPQTLTRMDRFPLETVYGTATE